MLSTDFALRAVEKGINYEVVLAYTRRRQESWARTASDGFEFPTSARLALDLARLETSKEPWSQLRCSDGDRVEFETTVAGIPATVQLTVELDAEALDELRSEDFGMFVSRDRYHPEGVNDFFDTDRALWSAGRVWVPPHTLPKPEDYRKYAKHARHDAWRAARAGLLDLYCDAQTEVSYFRLRTQISVQDITVLDWTDRGVCVSGRTSLRDDENAIRFLAAENVPDAIAEAAEVIAQMRATLLGGVVESHTASTCFDCPAYWLNAARGYDRHTCNLGSATIDEVLYKAPNGPPPDDCPLREGPALVKLVEE